jgi:hypothetical protein
LSNLPVKPATADEAPQVFRTKRKGTKHMAKVAADLQYSEEHEWLAREDGNVVSIGISAVATDEPSPEEWGWKRSQDPGVRLTKATFNDLLGAILMGKRRAQAVTLPR